ncbi:MAG TPA: TonB family protein [Candidatus Acidoferrales bacterium]|jgi:protein TonB|nr:TonB family protein [Candidatus Acidoferrales bacterium]
MSLPASHFDRNPRLPDRRAHFRQPVRSLAYVELGDGNGGIALNISEGGMAVQAVMSLAGDNLPSVRVQLSHSKKQIQIKGRVAWTGDLRKLAGVEFVDLADDTRKQIREWIALESPDAERFEAATEAVPEVADPQPEEVDAALAATQAASSREFQGPAQGTEETSAGSVEPSKQAPTVGFSSRPRISRTPAAAAPPALVSKPVQVEAAEIAGAQEHAATSVPIDTEIEPVQAPESPKLPVRATLPRTPRTSSFFFAASAPASASSAVAAPRDPTPVPDDRFGFRRASQPDSLLTAAEPAKTEKWKMSTWVPVFVVVALAAGWVAGRNMWRAGGQEPAVGSANSLAVTDTTGEAVSTTSNAPAQIEVLDLNGHRWFIPMQGGPMQTAPVRSSGPRVADSGAIPVPQTAMNLATPALASPRQSQASSDASKMTPPAVASASAGPNNVLPSGSATETRNIAPPPDTNASATEGLQPGELIHKVEPEYPAGALAQKVEGTVKILAVIDTAGNVKSAEPLSGPRMLIPAALNAVRQWKYSPTTLHNQPIETQRQVTIVFEVSKNP